MPFDVKTKKINEENKNKDSKENTPSSQGISIEQDEQALSQAEENVFDWTNAETRQRYFLELNRSKYKGVKTPIQSLTKEAATRSIQQFSLDEFSEREIHKAEQRFRSLIECMYKWQYKSRRKFLTEPQIISHINPLLRKYVGIMLTELEKQQIVVSLMHKNKKVFRLDDEFCLRIDERIHKIRHQRSEVIAEHLVHKIIDTSEKDVSHEVDTGDSPEDIFNTPHTS